MQACKYNNVKAAKFLLNCGLNVNKTDNDDLTAADYAWINESWSCLYEILLVEGTFPKSFDIHLLELPKDTDSRETIICKNAIISIADKITQFHIALSWES